MLTASQRRRCAEIAAVLDSGDGKAIAKAEVIAPLSPEERGLIWDLRQDVRAMYERQRQRDAAGAAVTLKQNFAARPARLETVSGFDDLDRWAETEPGDEDGDDEAADTVPCPVCNGRGKDASGNICESCKGTGPGCR
jgi:hypothetical protein